MSSSKRTLFLFFEGSNTCLYILFLQHGWKDFCGQTNFEFMFQGARKQRQASSQGWARASKQTNNLNFFHLQWFWDLIFGLKVRFLRFLSRKKQDVFQATFSKFLLHLYSILSRDVCVCVCIKGKLQDLAKETNLQV